MSALNSADTLGYIAGTLFFIGYVMVNQIRLRVLLLIGTMFYILYYALATEEPLWAAIYMSLFTGAANLFGLAKLLLVKSKRTIPAAHRDLYPHFDSLLPGDFRALLRDAKRTTLSQGHVLTQENAPVIQLFYVISGALEAEKHGERFGLPSGIFVGEVAYMTRGPSSATTLAAGDIEVLIWEFDALRRRAARNMRFKLALEATLSRDLAVKVAFAVAPHSPAKTASEPRVASAPTPRIMTRDAAP